MATFGEILNEVQLTSVELQRESGPDRVRRRHLKALHDLTGRNVVVYYSSWLQRQGSEYYYINQINDEDKHGFMAAFAGLEFNRGLDLILHTPGGDVAATESIIDYILSKFSKNIRVIVPQISMSGGTMIAIMANEIVMGRHSNLGPIDPQIGNRPAIAILKEFERAREEILVRPESALLWQPILQQYEPTLLSLADHSIRWAKEIGQKSLCEGMFSGEVDAKEKAVQIVEFLTSHDLHRAHGRHLHRNELRGAGLRIVDLENDAALQDAVLSVHHSCMLTVANHNVVKLIENHVGITHAKVSSQFTQQMMRPQAPVPADIHVNELSLRRRLGLAWQLIRKR